MCASPKIIETKITNTNEQTDGLLEKILTRDNLNLVYKQVKKNKGVGGIDGMRIQRRKERLLQIAGGWVNYFKLVDMRNILKSLDEWMRSQIRMLTWKRWKKVKTRFTNLKRWGLDEDRVL